MANNYVQFSEGIALENGDAKWLRDRIALFENPPKNDVSDAWKAHVAMCESYDLDDSESALEFESNISDAGAEFYADETGEPWHVCRLLQDLFRARGPKRCFTITWSLSCSKARAGEFGGGGAFVTAEAIKTFDAHSLVDEVRQAWEQTDAPCLTSG